MCGILGGWLHSEIPPDAIQAGLSAMWHRGPDDEGQYRDGPALLAMRRLAVIDVDHGHQPISNEDGTVWVVCNGEIYNYRELAEQLRHQGHQLKTASDTEVLVHLYEQYGNQMCQHLRGMFAFALWDRSRRRLLLGRDRFGKKPLYYYQLPDGGLVFASELKGLTPLLRASGRCPQLRSQAIYDYLSLGYVPQPSTVYEGVHALEPGHWLEYDGARLDTQRYWELDYRSSHQIPYGEALERVRELISESVRLRLRSDVPIGVFLSAGVDSSVVAYEAARHVGASLRTFTVGTGDADLDESRPAARTAQSLGVENILLPLHVAPLDDIQKMVRHYDQPFCDVGGILGLAISRVARQHVTVALNGDGGDEIFCGYRRYLAALWAQRLKRLPVANLLARASSGSNRRRRSLLGFGKRFARGLALPRGARYLVWTSDMLLERDKQPLWRGEPMRPTEDWISEAIPADLNDLNAQACGDHRINLLSNQLVKMDICTMVVSLEGRSPLLDHTIAEFVQPLPASIRMRRMRRKSLLRDAYRGLISDEVLNGRKRGFEPPLKAWLEGPLQELIQDTLAAEDSPLRNYVDSGFVLDILNKRTLGDRNWSYLVYGMLVLDLWLRGLE